MYRLQSTRSHVTECILTALIPPLVIMGTLVGIFAFVSHSEGLPLMVDVPFTLGAGLGTLLLSCGAAVCDWVEGPGMVPMTPAEEAAKRAEIDARVEAQMAQARVVGENPFATQGNPAYRPEHDDATDYDYW